MDSSYISHFRDSTPSFFLPSYLIIYLSLIHISIDANAAQADITELISLIENEEDVDADYLSSLLETLSLIHISSKTDIGRRKVCS